MNIAAILVSTKPENLLQVRESINSNDWSEVHYMDETGRMMITIEGNTAEEDVDRLKQVKMLPNVLSAEMVEYCFEDEAEQMVQSVRENTDVVPDYLNNDDLTQSSGMSYQKMKRLSNF